MLKGLVAKSPRRNQPGVLNPPFSAGVISFVRRIHDPGSVRAILSVVPMTVPCSNKKPR
jgi:hypothetical protein